MSNVALLPRTETVTGLTAVHSLNHESFVPTPIEASSIGGAAIEVLLLGQHNGGYSDGVEPEWDYSAVGVGSIQRAAPAASASGFMLQTIEPVGTAMDVAYWKAATINPAPVNGKHYRMLSVNDIAGRLLQYFDDEHREQRNSNSLPWNVIYGEEGPWPFERDAMMSLDGNTSVKYVEVELSTDSQLNVEAAEQALQSSGSEVTEPLAEEEVAVVTGPERALGYALIVDNQEPTLKPVMEPGKMYVAWKSNHYWRSRIAYLVSGMSNSRLSPIATLNGESEGEVILSGAPGNSLWDDEFDWVEAKALPAPTPVERSAESLNETIRLQGVKSELESSFDSFNDDLNELAVDKDWCEEYEGSVTPYGMKPRENRMKDWSVEISASVTISESSPSGRIDSAVSDSWGIGSISIDELRVEATIMVSITVSSTDQDDAFDQINSTMVEEAIDDMISNSVSIDVTDWDHEGTEEA